MKTVNGVTTVYVYDATSNLVAEYVAQNQPSPCGTTTCFVTVDHLGSTRMLTDSAGNVAKRYDYMPFGQEIPAGAGGRTTAQEYQSSEDGFPIKFTGQVRDSETGLDFMNARYYSSAQARFQGVDPGNAGADIGTPQSWNGYAYANNNPINLVDPSGQFIATAAIDLAGLFWGGVWGRR